MYGKKLRELREIEGWTQKEVARRLGVSKQTYSHYENEERRPSLDMVRELASVYSVNIDDIFAKDQDEKESQIVNIPIVGRIACGTGTLAFEDIEGYETVPSTWVSGGEYFFLRAKGDSMIGARIKHDDLLLIRKQPEVENGQIAAVMIGDEAVLKRVYKNGDTLVLQSENSAYQPIFCPPSEAMIIGKLKLNIINY